MSKYVDNSVSVCALCASSTSSSFRRLGSARARKSMSESFMSESPSLIAYGGLWLGGLVGSDRPAVPMRRCDATGVQPILREASTLGSFLFDLFLVWSAGSTSHLGCQ